MIRQDNYEQKHNNIIICWTLWTEERTAKLWLPDDSCFETEAAVGSLKRSLRLAPSWWSHLVRLFGSAGGAMRSDVTERINAIHELWFSRRCLWRMPSSWTLCRVALRRTDVPCQMLKMFLAREFFSPWRWRLHVPTIRPFSQGVHCATSLKTAFLMITVIH
jgi:hypothetical protein